VQRGEIWVVSLDPTAGHEQRGERRVVILSPAEFNRLTGGVPLVAPITTGGDFARMRGFAVSLSGLSLTTQGVVRCDQPRVLDLRARGGRPTRDKVPEAVMNDVLAKVGTLIE
jgi:mRNA interferase ChpB